MTGGSMFILAVFLSALVEFVVERFFGPFKSLKGWPMIFISAAVAVGLCFALRVDILELVGFESNYYPWVGKVISGILIGSGSNALHKFIKPGSKK